MILADGGYIDGSTYYFYMTDHLGNNRVVAKTDGTLVQKTHYYPFGSSFGVASGTSTQPYKYNGKELDRMHQLNLYDDSARYYESAIDRFTSVDPRAEKYYRWSPCVYVGNNPINAVDLRGDSITFTSNNKDLLKQTTVLINSGVSSKVAKIDKMGFYP